MEVFCFPSDYMEIPPEQMGESGGVNGVDLVGRSGARNSQEFRKRFIDELSDYPYWCNCEFGTNYTCNDAKDIDGVRHSTYECLVCKRNCTLRIQTYSQMRPTRTLPATIARQDRSPRIRSATCPSP